MIRAKVQSYLERNLGVEFSSDGSDATPETNLFETGLIDSFSFVQLVSFLESEFGIKISTAEAMSPQLANLVGIESFVEMKQSRAAR